MALDKDLIEEIKSRADIVDIISSYISVTKKGRNYFAVCPFHDDHNPSLSINKDKNIFKCFVCGTSGDVFSFVSKYEKISYVDAVKRVAELINFDDSRLHESFRLDKPVDENLQTLYRCASELQKFYSYSLLTDEGAIARKYLKDRDISEEQIEKFKIGYCPKDGSSSIEYLKRKGFSLKNIEDIGISIVKTNGMNDNNAGRLIFPIVNSNDQVVGFSARRLNNNSDEAKYVNSPETKIFSKGNVLYNMHNAKQTLKRDGYLYVVEGFMDVFALDAIGIPSVVGLMGTAMTKSNVEQLRRCNVEIRLCLDNDNAGQIAMMAIMKMFDSAKVSYRLVSKPEEKMKDSDEILKKEGPEALKVYVNTLVDPFYFALNFYTHISPLNTSEDKKKVIKHFAPMIANLTTKIEQNDYIYKLASATGFDANAIRDFIADYKKHPSSNSDERIDFSGFPTLQTNRVKREVLRLNKAERTVLLEMLESKDAVRYYENNIKYFYNEVYRTIANFIIEYSNSHDVIDTSNIIGLIETSEINNKEEVVNEVTSISFDKAPPYSKELMDDCSEIINVERNKIYERNRTAKALEGKSDEEKARILRDYLNRTNPKT